AEKSDRPGGDFRRQFEAFAAFERDLIEDVIPYIESHYATRADREHRALAGLSMGGGQSLDFGLGHLDTFAWVGGFSSAPNTRPAAELIADPAAARAKLRLLWVSCGDEDRLMDISQRFHEALKEMKVPHVWHVDSGGHTWPVWRNDLYLLARRLFRDGPPPDEESTAPASTRAARRAPRRPSPGGDAPRSPEVAPDHRVTFRIVAPKASEVSVAGDFGAGGRLTQDDRGTWSITVGPLVPDVYSYSFTVDGVRTLDPNNAQIKPGVSRLDSVFEVPGDEAAFEALRDVPHGEVRAVWYRSGTLGTQRRMHVYTPPGYEGGDAKYPVLYLLHGSGDDDLGWSTIGRAGFILDNLLADGRAVPMLVVMPNGSLPRPAGLSRLTPGAPPSPEVRAAMETIQNRFTDELLKEVVPTVETTYRVRSGRENRAIAGLSMGGGQALRVVTTHPDQFAFVGIWSAGIFGDVAEFARRNEEFLGRADQVNEHVKLFSIRVGDQDFTLAGSQGLAELLQQHGIRHELRLSGGGHTWINWRHYLNDFAPRLFR
ncbi:MAG TPA: alpha/beta hydrolase-fold protein, partial [Isosphaeraceae bacterium]